MTHMTDIAAFLAATALVAAACSSDPTEVAVPRSTDSVEIDSAGAPVRADGDPARFAKVRVQQPTAVTPSSTTSTPKEQNVSEPSGSTTSGTGSPTRW